MNIQYVDEFYKFRRLYKKILKDPYLYLPKELKLVSYKYLKYCLEYLFVIVLNNPFDPYFTLQEKYLLFLVVAILKKSKNMVTYLINGI